jgi:hypothetical protein
MKCKEDINRKTLQASVEVIIFNGELNSFASIVVTMAFQNNGLVEASSEVSSLNMGDGSSFFKVAGVLLGLFILRLCVQELLELSHRGVDAYCSDMTNVLDLAMGISCAMVIFGFFRKQLLVSDLAFPKLDTTYNDKAAATAAFQAARGTLLSKLHDVMWLENRTRNLCAISTIIISIRILKYMAPWPRLNVIARTVSDSMKPLGSFCVVFFVIFLGYVWAGVMLFGSYMPEFKTANDAAISLMNLVLLGEHQWPDMYKLGGVAGFYFWSFLFVVFLTLLNVMLAIVMDTYSDVKSELEALPSPALWSSFAAAAIECICDCNPVVVFGRYAKKGDAPGPSSRAHREAHGGLKVEKAHRARRAKATDQGAEYHDGQVVLVNVEGQGVFYLARVEGKQQQEEEEEEEEEEAARGGGDLAAWRVRLLSGALQEDVPDSWLSARLSGGDPLAGAATGAACSLTRHLWIKLCGPQPPPPPPAAAPQVVPDVGSTSVAVSREPVLGSDSGAGWITPGVLVARWGAGAYGAIDLVQTAWRIERAESEAREGGSDGTQEQADAIAAAVATATAEAKATADVQHEALRGELKEIRQLLLTIAAGGGGAAEPSPALPAPPSAAPVDASRGAAVADAAAAAPRPPTGAAQEEVTIF